MNAVAAQLPVTIISVSYASAKIIGDMLLSVPAGVRVIVVDNASPDDSVAVARAGGAEVVALQHNIGFGPACNAGAALATTPFLLFLNPDARLTPECVGQLVAAAAQHPTATAFNPRVTDGAGKPHFKRRSVLLPRAERMPRGWPAGDREVMVLSGAALFCRRDAFNAVGGFDPAIFLYHEDDDLALRLKALGPLRFVHAALVMHLEGRSSPRTPTMASLKAFHMARSRVYAMRKHGRPLPFLRSLFLACSAWLLPTTYFSARRRAKSAAFISGVWSMRESAAP